MPVLNFSFHMSDLQLATVDAMRDKMDREEFLCFCLQLGITDMQEESSRAEKDGIFQVVLGQTQNYHKARTLRRVTLPDDTHIKKAS